MSRNCYKRAVFGCNEHPFEKNEQKGHWCDGETNVLLKLVLR